WDDLRCRRILILRVVRTGAASRRPEVPFVVNGLLLHVGQKTDKEGIALRAAWDFDFLVQASRQRILFGRYVVMNCEAQLLALTRKLGPPGRLASGLNRGEQKRYQDSDNCNDDEQFD